MRLTRPLVLAAGAALATSAALLAPGSAQAAPAWAPADEAAIHPGVQMYTDGGQCTGNFVFTDAAGSVYVGYAAHCAGTGEATQTNGCEVESAPLGTRVSFQESGNVVTGGTEVGTGTLAYSSWEAMNRVGTTDADTCAHNDFALVKVSEADKGKVNPSIPFFGGPTGVDTDGAGAGEQVYSYGNSSLRGGVEVFSPKFGTSLGTTAGGWSHPVYTVSPGVPGDSGSAFVNAEGQALGTLSTLSLAPVPASNGVGDLSRELAFAQANSGIAGLRLVEGTEEFRALPLP